MTIHREGISTLVPLLLIFAALYFGVGYIFPNNEIAESIYIGTALLIFLFFLQFFRNPKVKTELDLKNVIAPADGKVVVIEEAVETEYFNEPRRQVSIFMSPLNVHVNRNPISGIVKKVVYHEGKYLVAWHPKSSTENERTTIVLQGLDGTEVLMRQIAGAVARRIRWYVKEGDKALQGQEFGFIKFGSRVDIFLPLDAEIKVKIGDKTKGGRTVLAKLSGPVPEVPGFNDKDSE